MTPSCRPAKVLSVLLSGWLVLGAAGAARAQGEMNRPYELQIVLHVGEHPWLTEVFRDRVARELRDSLQAALGDLARVSVVSKHPRLRDVIQHGLERALDGWAERTGVKTHFVLIDFVGTEYEIRARQHDGLTGRPSRVVRRDRTRDRDFVAKAAALLVAHDFGMVGVLAGEPDAQKMVTINLKTVKPKAGDPTPLARWVPKGSLFEVVPPGGTAALDWALLQVVEPPDADGTCSCKLWHRFRLPLVTGCQCMMLGTTRAPLRLRFVQEQERGVRKPLNRILSVEVRRHGFQGEPDRLQMPTDGGGWLDASVKGDQGAFDDLAFVTVTSLEPVPQIPVALVDDRPVIVPVTVTADGGGIFSARRVAWERSVSESLLVQVGLFKEIQELAAKPENRERALERARAGVQRTRDDYSTLAGRRDELAREAARSNIQFNPAREERRLKDLKEGGELLQKFIDEQEVINARETDPTRKGWRSDVERGKLLEKDLEFGQALAIYNRVLAAGMNSPELVKHRDELARLWKPKSDAHRRARSFIYLTWKDLDTAGLKARMKDARAAFEECKRAGDLIGPQKLLLTGAAHAERLKVELSGLQPNINIDDEKPAKVIEEVSKGLQELATDIQAYLETKGEEGGP
jgi:hypothetical protein